MTYDADTSLTLTNTKPQTDTLMGMPYGPECLDTSRLRAIIPILVAKAALMVCPSGVLRGALARLWEVRRLFAQLYRAEKHNAKQMLVSAMQASPSWQRQVREDLGGEAALKRWDKRYARMIAGETPKSVTVPKPKTKTKTKAVTRKPSKTRTDRHNMFRLARLSKETETPNRAPANTTYASREAALRISMHIAPIALTPDQLRPPKASVESPANSNSGPALSSYEIMRWWHKIASSYMLFNFKIMNIDLMIHVRICRIDPLPT